MSAAGVETANERVLSNVSSGHSVMVINPLAMRQPEAATCIGFSTEWLRRARFSDIQRLRETTARVEAASKAMGGSVAAGAVHPEDAARALGIDFDPIQGPRWFRVGQTVLYSSSDLEAWIREKRGAA